MIIRPQRIILDDARPGVSPTPTNENTPGKRAGRPGRKPGRRPGPKPRPPSAREPSERLKPNEDEKVGEGNVPEDETSDTESIDR